MKKGDQNKKAGKDRLGDQPALFLFPSLIDEEERKEDGSRDENNKKGHVATEEWDGDPILSSDEKNYNPEFNLVHLSESCRNNDPISGFRRPENKGLAGKSLFNTSFSAPFSR